MLRTPTAESAAETLAEDPLRAVATLSDRTLLTRTLRGARERGELPEVVRTLSLYIAAAEEPDPSSGRWETIHPGNMRATLLATGEHPDELLEAVDRHVERAPHRLGSELPRQLAHIGYPVPGGNARRAWRELLSRLARGRGVDCLIPQAHVDDIVHIASCQYNAAVRREDGSAAAWADLLGRCDRFSRQRYVAAAAFRGRADLVAPVIITGGVWDLDLITRKLLDIGASDAAEDLVERVEAGYRQQDIPYRSDPSLRYILEEIAWASDATTGLAPGIAFWSDRPVACYRGSELLEDLRRRLDSILLADQDAYDIAQKLSLDEVTLREFHETVEGILQPVS